jgi:branched-chain amino acid transport system ATP-binding protein
MSVAQNVELAAQATLSGTAGALRLWRRVGQEARDTAARALDLARLAGRAAATASTLSHGEKRKLELAILLACRPRVILLDEPMAGMAAEEVPELTEVIRDAHRGGATILMVEHHMDVVMGLAERIAVLHHGALLASGTPAAISADPAVRDAYMGEPL